MPKELNFMKERADEYIAPKNKMTVLLWCIWYTRVSGKNQSVQRRDNYSSKFCN